MQEQIDYVIVENTSTAAVDGVSIMDKGLFVGTKKCLYFIPEKFEEYTTKEITISTLTLGNELPSKLVINKLNESSVNTRDFQHFMTELGKLINIGEVNLEEDIEQLKVTANFLGGAIYINDTFRKVGWKGFVLKTGKKKKLVREFYLSHPKLSNK